MKIYAAILLAALAACSKNPATPNVMEAKTEAPGAPMKESRRVDEPDDFADRMAIDFSSDQEDLAPMDVDPGAGTGSGTADVGPGDNMAPAPEGEAAGANARRRY
jgi:hypothetical protein